MAAQWGEGQEAVLAFMWLPPARACGRCSLPPACLPPFLVLWWTGLYLSLSLHSPDLYRCTVHPCERAPSLSSLPPSSWQVTNVREASKWMSYTYLYTRMAQVNRTEIFSAATSYLPS